MKEVKNQELKKPGNSKTGTAVWWPESCAARPRRSGSITPLTVHKLQDHSALEFAPTSYEACHLNARQKTFLAHSAPVSVQPCQFPSRYNSSTRKAVSSNSPPPLMQNDLLVPSSKYRMFRGAFFSISRNSSKWFLFSKCGLLLTKSWPGKR